MRAKLFQTAGTTRAKALGQETASVEKQLNKGGISRERVGKGGRAGLWWGFHAFGVWIQFKVLWETVGKFWNDVI